jgi:chorismate mutase
VRSKPCGTQKTSIGRILKAIFGPLKLHTKIANDQKRVDDQIQVIVKKSEQVGLPKEISVETFKAIIKNSIEFEQKYFDHLTR